MLQKKLKKKLNLLGQLSWKPHHQSQGYLTAFPGIQYFSIGSLIPGLHSRLKGLLGAIVPIVYQVPHCNHVGRTCGRVFNCQLKIAA